MKKSNGRVILVGAGPGDPGLLSLRGAEALRTADVVLYDYLAGEQFLSHVRPDAVLHCLGRHGHGKLWAQEDINQRLIADAREGLTVVRLKGGDPAIFGRLAEELTALDEAKVTYEIVPGITAATAVGSYAGIPLTNRDVASCVTFITGQECLNKQTGEGLNYEVLAAMQGTLVFYMGVTTAPIWSRALIQHGKSADTPVAIIRRCSLPDQAIIAGKLGDVPEMLAPGKVRPPVVVIVGEVATEQHVHYWFTSRPLSGSTVLVTRPKDQAEGMATEFIHLGARVLVQPAIAIGPPADWSKVDDALGRLGEFDWLVFSSRNGVESFLDRLTERGQDARALAGVQIAAIGPATAEALEERSLRADLYPSTYRAEALADALASDAPGKRFLLVRASRGREVLAEMLAEAGGSVEQVVAYESRDVAEPAEDIAQALRDGEVDWTTVTSSAIARSLVGLFGDELKKTRLAAISPLTASVLGELGYEAAVVAAEYTAEGLVEAILAAERR